MRSIYKNFDDLQVTLSQLHLEVDIMILTECRLDSVKNIPVLNNYTSYQTAKNLNQNDGVVVYIRDHLQAEITELSLNNATGLQIVIADWCVLLAIYRSPSHLYADSFVDSLNTHLESISYYKNISIIGDINIDLIISEQEKSYERNNRLRYLNALSLHGILPGHMFCTREDPALITLC